MHPETPRRFIAIHELPGQIQSIFLIEYPDRLLLLDGGCRCDAIGITRYITQTLHRPMSDLRLAVVTHMHPDHAGGIMQLKRRYSVTTAAHADADNWYAGPGGAVQHLMDVSMAWFVALRKKSPFHRLWYRRRLDPDYRLVDNDPLPGFPDWRVIAVPGHTTHDIALYHAETGVLYVADLAVSVRDRLTLPIPVTIPELMERSLRTLSSLPCATLLLAHGGRMDDLSPGIFTQLIEHIGNRSRLSYRILLLLCSFPGEIRKTARRLRAAM